MKTAKILAAAVLVAFGLQAAPASAAKATVEVGRLSCKVAPGVGLIFGSIKKVTCSFHQTGKPTETYHGEITKVGIDIGFTDTTRIEWLVFAATSTKYKHGALAGTYVGATGEATLGVGMGANALVGGSHKGFVLQPFSVQAQTGVNLAVGVAGLTLK